MRPNGQLGIYQQRSKATIISSTSYSHHHILTFFSKKINKRISISVTYISKSTKPKEIAKNTFLDINFFKGVINSNRIVLSSQAEIQSLLLEYLPASNGREGISILRKFRYIGSQTILKGGRGRGMQGFQEGIKELEETLL